MRTVRIVINGVDKATRPLGLHETSLELQHELSRQYPGASVRVIEQVSKRPRRVKREERVDEA